MNDGLPRAIKLIRELRQIHPAITLTNALALLIAARHEGCSLSFLMQQTGATKSTLSRYVQDLSDDRWVATGHGLLITWERPENRREKVVFLTESGRALVARIEEILRHP